MATVTGLTATRMQAIEAASVVGGTVVDERLILTKKDATTIDAGNVRGPVGPSGPAGDVSNAGLRRGLFSAYRSSNFNVVSNAWTQVPMNAEEFDLSGWHGTSGFTPQLAGYYRLSASLFSDSIVSSGTRLILGIFKNNSLFKEIIRSYKTASSDNSVSGSVIVLANGTTDVFSPAFHQNLGSGMNILGAQDRTYFQGELIAPTV